VNPLAVPFSTAQALDGRRILNAGVAVQRGYGINRATIWRILHIFLVIDRHPQRGATQEAKLQPGKKMERDDFIACAFYTFRVNLFP
jgi:hypothetical protein